MTIRRLVILTLIACAGTAWAQSRDLKKAHRTFDEAGVKFGEGEAARGRGDADKANAAYGESTALLRDAQSLLWREMYRYRYYEALALMARGEPAKAWPLLVELTRQTHEEQVAADAAVAIERFLAELDDSKRALLRIDCGGDSIKVMVTFAEDSPSAGSDVADIGAWTSCDRWSEPRPLPPGSYKLDLRRERDDAVNAETSMRVHLGVGDDTIVAAHFAMAPAPDVYVLVDGGCGAAPGLRRAPRGAGAGSLASRP